MKLNRSWCAFTLSAALAILPAGAATVLNTAERTMQDAGAQAFSVCDNAQTLYMSAPESNLSWQGQATRLEYIKIAVQQMAGDVAHLNLWGDMESTPERRAVREANPVLKDLANETTAAIRFLNNNTGSLYQPEYRAHLRKISQDADQIRALFRESTKLNSLDRKAARLRDELSHS